MKLTDEQLEYIRHEVDREAMSRKSLGDDLIDHFCCGVEELMWESGMDFQTAFLLTRQKLIPNGALEIEEDLNYLETYKPQVFMKKFVFASGYLSSLCLIVGIALITLSFFKRESVKMDRLKNEKSTYVAAYDLGEKKDPHAVERSYREFEFRQASLELEVLHSASSMFSIGQNLLILALAVFSVTILPYHFYSRYQRSMLDFQHA